MESPADQPTDDCSLDDTIEADMHPLESSLPCILYFSSLDHLEFVLPEGRKLSTRSQLVDYLISYLWHPQEDRLIGFQLHGFHEIATTFQGSRSTELRASAPPLADLLNVSLERSWASRDRERLHQLALQYVIPEQTWADALRWR